MKRFIFTAITLFFSSFSFAQDRGLDDRINEAFTPIADWWGALVLHNFPGTSIPSIIFLLVGGALFFTVYFGFINLRRFPLAINVVRGKFDHVDHQEIDKKAAVNFVDGDAVNTIKDESKDGEVSHFQALATAVSGTVGNGNIAGVALAIAIGGPGATFWMILCGLIGMSTKFVECTLGVKYRDVGEDGTVYGGPMYYLTKGLKERGFARMVVSCCHLCLALYWSIFWRWKCRSVKSSSYAAGKLIWHGRWECTNNYWNIDDDFCRYNHYWRNKTNRIRDRKNSAIYGALICWGLPIHYTHQLFIC